MTEHTITPPLNLVASLRNSAPHGIGDAGVTRELWLINHAFAAGADQELGACCEWLDYNYLNVDVGCLRAAMRPKPPSLKEQALELLPEIKSEDVLHLCPLQVAKIRRALNELPE